MGLFSKATREELRDEVRLLKREAAEKREYNELKAERSRLRDEVTGFGSVKKKLRQAGENVRKNLAPAGTNGHGIFSIESPILDTALEKKKSGYTSPLLDQAAHEGFGNSPLLSGFNKKTEKKKQGKGDIVVRISRK